MRAMPSCKDLVENADAYLEGTLPWWERGQIRLHLWLCSHCRRYVAQLRATIEALQSLPAPEGPPLTPPVRDELMTSFRSMKAGASQDEPTGDPPSQ